MDRIMTTTAIKANKKVKVGGRGKTGVRVRMGQREREYKSLIYRVRERGSSCVPIYKE